MFYKVINLLLIIKSLFHLLLTFLILVILVIQSMITILLLLLHLQFFPYQTYLLFFLVIYFQVLQNFCLLKDLLYTFDVLEFILNFKFHLASFLNFFLFVNQMLKSQKLFPFSMKWVFLFMENFRLRLINLQLISIKLKFFTIICSKYYFNQ